MLCHLNILTGELDLLIYVLSYPHGNRWALLAEVGCNSMSLEVLLYINYSVSFHSFSSKSIKSSSALLFTVVSLAATPLSHTKALRPSVVLKPSQSNESFLDLSSRRFNAAETASRASLNSWICGYLCTTVVIITSFVKRLKYSHMKIPW